MKTTKSLIQSKTFHGAVAVILSVLVGLVFGVEVTDMEILDIITNATILIWSIYAIVWRIMATEEITSIS